MRLSSRLMRQDLMPTLHRIARPHSGHSSTARYTPLPLNTTCLQRLSPQLRGYHRLATGLHAPLRLSTAVPGISRPRVLSAAAVRPQDFHVELDVLVEGEPLPGRGPESQELALQLESDGKAVAQEAVYQMWLQQGASTSPRPVEVSLVLCGDDHIAELNAEWRGVQGPTDVLSFALQEDEEADDQMDVTAEASETEYPNLVLGDVVISLQTAERQAQERGHSLVSEVRILLVHGVLHLLGYDHEAGAEGAREMAAEERRVLRALGWAQDGLIGAASGGLHGEGEVGSSSESSSTTVVTAGASSSSSSTRRRAMSDIRLLALDMDGTLLDSNSKILPSSVEALKAALARGVMVMLATGKARPAAIKAMQAVGLAGPGLVVSTQGPGIFLQGLAVYGSSGDMLTGEGLGTEVVRQAFEFSATHGVPCCAFLGDDCATLDLAPELRELHSVYYEPLARVEPSLQQLLAGPAVKKLLFMTEPHRVEGLLKPHWQAAAPPLGAEAMQAVPNMLEIVPAGVNKWVGAQLLLQHLGLPREALMAVGDGGNDLHLVANAGLGVAMGNAVPQVKEVAAYISATNDDDGVAEAIEHFLL